MYDVRTFLDANFTNERELGKGREQGTEIGRKRTQGTQKMGNSKVQTRAGSGGCRILVAIFVTERSRMFAYTRLKSLMFAFFEKKYFFRRCGHGAQTHNGWGCGMDGAEIGPFVSGGFWV